MARGRLILENQAVRSRSLQNMLAVTGAMSAALAARLGRPADDFRVRALCGACLGAMIESIMAWMIEGAEIVDLAKSIDERARGGRERHLTVCRGRRHSRARLRSTPGRPPELS